MENLIKEIPLPNGLVIRFYDQTRNYYGDFYLVKLAIHCDVPLRTEFFADEKEWAEAAGLLGNPAVYRRTVEQMGVPSTAIGMVTERLIDNFTGHSLPYFSAESFPRKFVLTELSRARKKASAARRFGADHHA